MRKDKPRDRGWRSAPIAALRDHPSECVEVWLDHRINIVAPLEASLDELTEAVRQAVRMREGLLHPDRDQRADEYGELVCRYLGLGWTEREIADMLAEQDPAGTIDVRRVKRWAARWRQMERARDTTG